MVSLHIKFKLKLFILTYIQCWNKEQSFSQQFPLWPRESKVLCQDHHVLTLKAQSTVVPILVQTQGVSQFKKDVQC